MFQRISTHIYELKTRKKALHYLLFSARQYSWMAKTKEGMAECKSEVRFAYKSCCEYVKVCSDTDTHPIPDLLAYLVALTTIKMQFDKGDISQNNLRNSIIRLTTAYRINYCSLPKVDLSSPQDRVTNNKIEKVIGDIKAVLNSDKEDEKQTA